MTSQHILEVRELQKTYRLPPGPINFFRSLIRKISLLLSGRSSEAVLTNLSFSIPAGKVVGFLGANGAGKTTTMKTILGLLFKDSGSFFYQGSKVANLAGSKMESVASMIEAPAFHGYLTGRQNLSLLARLRGLSSEDVNCALEEVGLAEAADRSFSEYSTGMGQRLAMAACMLGQSRFLILDEPANGMDPMGQNQMRSIIRKLSNQHGVTVFISSHQLHEVEQLCDHVIIIHGGKLVVQGAVAELLSQNSETYDLLLTSPEELSKARELLGKYDWVTAMEPVAQMGLQGLRLVMKSGKGPETLACIASASVAVAGFIPQRRSLEEFYLQALRESDDLGGGQ